MVAIPQPKGDAMLALADRAIEENQERKIRPYLGMSAIGNECQRQLWYNFRWVQPNDFDAATLKRFADGHLSEDVAVARLAAPKGIELHAVDENGEQFGFKDLGGHFSGHMDGVILGIPQAPKTWHVLEIKSSAKWKDLDKAVEKYGEKNALREWNATYYAQAVLYMDYAEITRHYTVCVSPGAREWTAVRTNADPAFAEVLKRKAERIIYTDIAPERIGGPDFYKCRWCDYANICHEGDKAKRNCRTCLHSSAMRDGGWDCQNPDKPVTNLSTAQQSAGCDQHRYLPSLIAGTQTDAGPRGITYTMQDGSEWTDTGDN